MSAQCQIRTDALDAYAQDLLNAAQRARLDAHLPECPACRKRLEDIEAESSVLGFSFRRIEVPPARCAASELVAQYARQPMPEKSSSALGRAARSALQRTGVLLGASCRRTGWPVALRTAGIAAAAGIILCAVGSVLWNLQSSADRQEQQTAEVRDQAHRRDISLQQWQDAQAAYWQQANRQLREDLSARLAEQLGLQRQILLESQARAEKTIGSLQSELERLSSQLGEQRQRSSELVNNMEAERQKLQEALKSQQQELAKLTEQLKAKEGIEIALANSDDNSPGEDWSKVPLSPAAQKGVNYLILAQANDGGWGQQIDDPTGRTVRTDPGPTDVANTCVATLALFRAGNTPTRGAHKDKVAKAITYVVVRVEESPPGTLTVSTRQGTQIQGKVGPNVDTYLASMVLAEADSNMPDANTNGRVRAALQKMITKLERNQQPDGSWNGQGGWAPILGTSFASRSLYLARRKGATVNPKVLEKVESWTKDRVNSGSSATKDAGAAGIKLYDYGQAYEQLSRTEQARKDNAALLKTLAKELNSDEVFRGFGSMGGEEFFSYLNISDGLHRSGGDEWKAWNSKITGHLEKIQNSDGTWAGHHCITGRVACTGAAVLALTSERGQ